MSKGPLHSTGKSDLEYWAKTLYHKRYEYLSDEQAEAVWNALEDFLLEWQEEQEKMKGVV